MRCRRTHVIPPRPGQRHRHSKMTRAPPLRQVLLGAATLHPAPKRCTTNTKALLKASQHLKMEDSLARPSPQNNFSLSHSHLPQGPQRQRLPTVEARPERVLRPPERRLSRRPQRRRQRGRRRELSRPERRSQRRPQRRRPRKQRRRRRRRRRRQLAGHAQARPVS